MCSDDSRFGILETCKFQLKIFRQTYVVLLCIWLFAFFSTFANLLKLGFFSAIQRSCHLKTHTSIRKQFLPSKYDDSLFFTWQNYVWTPCGIRLVPRCFCHPPEMFVPDDNWILAFFQRIKMKKKPTYIFICFQILFWKISVTFSVCMFSLWCSARTKIEIGNFDDILRRWSL